MLLKQRLKRIEVHYIYMYEDSIIKPTKHCLKSREREKRYGSNRWMNLFKVHVAHEWSYHNEIPHTLLYAISKIKLNLKRIPT
jgi:hypothetical protein